METSGKIQESKFSENTNLSSNSDLHIVGFKVKLDGEEAYTFALDEAKSKSADVLTISADSRKLKLTSTCNENKELEIHIKSKDDAKDPSSKNEGLCSYITDQLTGFSNTDLQSSHRAKSPVVSLKHITEISTSGSQTNNETASTAIQTTSVEVKQPTRLHAKTTQTDKIHEVSTATEEKILESVQIQTDAIKKIQTGIQTEKETATGYSQTETAAIYSIDKEYDKSVQTEQTEDAETSTDFDTYIVDRQRVSQKSVDTEDLPFAPLVVAKEEKKGTGKVTEDQACDCPCGHRNHTRCIYKCCFHKGYANIMPRSLTHCPYQQCVTYSSGIPQCGFCHCPTTSNCDSTCNENFRFDIHQLHCCTCKNLNSPSNSEPSKEKLEKSKTLRSIPIDKVKCNTSAIQEATYEPSAMKICKNLEKELEKISTITAIRVLQPKKIEKADFLKIPVIIEQFLTSFEFSTYRRFRAVVNPISIDLSVTEKPKVTEKEEKRRLNVKLPKETIRNPLLMFLGRKKKESVTLSPTSRPVALAGDKYPRIHFRKNSAACSSDKESKPSSKDKMRSASTSPKIESKGFNYMSKDMWKPCDRSDDVLHKNIENTDIIYVGQNSSDESVDSAKKMGLKDACEVVNDHLLSLRPVDKSTVRKAAETLHRKWFESAGSKRSELREVMYYIQYFQEYSNNLLKTLLHSVDNNGNNVLHFAFANNRFDLAEEFLNYGLATDLLRPNKKGNSPLVICSISQPKSLSDWSVVRRTLEMGDVNAMSVNTGQTPLMNAASCGFQAMVDLLLEIGAHPNLQDKDGSTALMYAAEHGHENCIKSIVKHRKCDPTIRDKDGQTACSIALSNGHKNIAVLIHMQALEKRRLSKNSYSSKRHTFTGNQTPISSRRKEAAFMIPRLSASSDSI